jgi:hypothetical protein
MAATIKIKFYVNELDNVMSAFDQVKVYRSDTETGTYAEITGLGTRVDLVTGTVLYEYIDGTAPDNTYWYKTAYFNSSTTAESTKSDPIQGTDLGLIVSLQDIRDEGISVSELSDARAVKLSQDWQTWFETMTGNIFTEKSAVVDFDGDGSRLLQLPIPIITVNNLYVNDDFTNAVDTSSYVVYNRRGPIEDDRRNPRIKLVKTTNQSIFSRSTYGGIFSIGDLNQRVDGVWGHVEEDGSSPEPVRRAILILVISTKEYIGDSEIDQLKFGKIIEEVTDRHRIEYADLYNRLKAWSPTGISEVDMALAAYRAPMRITAPRPMGLFDPVV